MKNLKQEQNTVTFISQSNGYGYVSRDEFECKNAERVVGDVGDDVANSWKRRNGKLTIIYWNMCFLNLLLLLLCMYL